MEKEVKLLSLFLKNKILVKLLSFERNSIQETWWEQIWFCSLTHRDYKTIFYMENKLLHILGGGVFHFEIRTGCDFISKWFFWPRYAPLIWILHCHLSVWFGLLSPVWPINRGNINFLWWKVEQFSKLFKAFHFGNFLALTTWLSIFSNIHS